MWLDTATACVLVVSLMCGSALAQSESGIDVQGIAGGADVAPSSSNVDIKVEAFLDLTRMDFYDTATLTLKLNWQKDEFSLTEKSAPKLELVRLRVGSVSTKTKPFVENGSQRILQEFVYTLIPTASGDGVILPARIGFTRNSDSQSGSVSTSELRLLVLMPKAEEKESLDWKVTATLLVVLFAGIGLLMFSVIRKRRKQAVDELASREQSSLNQALGELKAASSDTKADFFDRLYGFIYDFLHEAGIVGARKGDVDSIISDLNDSELHPEIKEQLVNWLEFSAKEKFSPGRGTPGETLRVYYEVEAFMRERWPR